MTERTQQSIAGILLSRIVGIIVFLILLGLLNILAESVLHGAIFQQVVAFLNANVWLLILITVILLIGELFGALVFPLNLPAPIFSAIGSVFIVLFIFRVFDLAATISGVAVLRIFESFAYLIYPLVFLVVLIGGYITIAVESGRVHSPEEEGFRREGKP